MYIRKPLGLTSVLMLLLKRVKTSRSVFAGRGSVKLFVWSESTTPRRIPRLLQHDTPTPRTRTTYPHTTSLAATGEIITEHYIDTARDYQKPYWKKGDPPLDPKHEKPAPQNKND